MIEIGDLRFSYDEGDFSLEIPELKVAHGETVAIRRPERIRQDDAAEPDCGYRDAAIRPGYYYRLRHL